MNKAIVSVIAAGLICATTCAAAQIRPLLGANRNQPLEFTFNGAGTVPCVQATQLMATPESRFQLEQWLHGYLAAYNHYAYAWNRVQLPTADVMLNYVDSGCKQNQQERLLAAAGSLVRELGGVPPLFR